jgi:succinate-semialdehyde dehydrogenase/glutarate-semialdehyde dehydrogenase
MFYSINPFSREILGEFQAHSEKEMAGILETSQQAFNLWKKLRLSDRLGFLDRLADLLENRIEILAFSMSEEMGKTLTEARAEVQKCAYGIRFFVEKSPLWLAEKKVQTDARLSEIHYQPLGGILLVMPWNFPLWQVIRAGIPALCAGNVLVLKHAPNVFRFSGMIEALFQEAGFPKGVFQQIRVQPDALDPICGHPAIAAVSLTGSERAGRAMAAVAGKHLRKCVLELGGSDPFIVMPDADLSFASDMAARARLINNGQSCIAAKRFLIHQSVEKQFLDLFQARLAEFLPANPCLPDTKLGPQAREDLSAALEIQLERTLKAGAELVYRMEVPFGNGFFFLPALVKGVKPGMACFDEEVFGPIASVSSFETTEECLLLANQTRFGLGASIYTSDENTAMKMALALDCGTVAINAMVRSKPALPFGGIKASGFGREMSEIGLYEFTNPKSVSIG